MNLKTYDAAVRIVRLTRQLEQDIATVEEIGGAAATVASFVSSATFERIKALALEDLRSQLATARDALEAL